MYTVYFIVSEKTNFLYIGMTGNPLRTRMSQHRHAANRGKKSPLYDCMRKHGVNNFVICVRDSFETKEECQQSERDWIAHGRKEGWKLLNLTDGGKDSYVVPEEIITLSFKEATLQYGISKTHYYRLLKRTKSNDLS